MSVEPSQSSLPMPAAKPSWWRMLLRLPFLLLHLLIGIPVTVATFNGIGRRIRVGQLQLDEFMLRWWSGTLCRIFGFRVKAIGELAPGPVLLVANHLSWLDIQLLHSQGKMGFVGKAEIGRWPLLGWLARAGGTVFHQRGSSDSQKDVINTITRHLNSGARVAIFPEGGIKPGVYVKRFHARFLAAANAADCPVQPCCIRYLYLGRINPGTTFLPGESFIANLLRLLGQPASDVELHFLQPIVFSGRDRRSVADQAQAAVVQAYGA